MRIALLQTSAEPLNPEANLAAIRDAAERARAAGAELLLTPELFVSGYAPVELADWLTPERIADFPEALSAIARETGIAVAAGFPLARPDESYAIAAGLWDAAGDEVLRYEKVHLWGADERLAFTPSSTPPRVAEWNGRRVAFQICYDIEFPEPARFAAAQGADLLLVPTAIDGDSAYVPEVLVRARAAENRIVVAYADHSGGIFAGLSIVAGFEGAVLASAGTEAELLVADLPDPEPSDLERPSVGAGAMYLQDHRPEVYAAWR
ncbi:nitrilase-related carbon-nitrogen hydrolase [Leucobacter sp. USHLN153]|uniref:nitrilase-related carbon-nitrogen hydrolase n=1 Tax=Leucobacter sp. USHLN153 TaxID=3081268 RepID=UPI0030166A7E